MAFHLLFDTDSSLIILGPKDSSILKIPKPPRDFLDLLAWLAVLKTLS
jgi:hypothetical protein